MKKITLLLFFLSLTVLGNQLYRTVDQMIRVGDFGKAETQLRSALESDPDNPNLLWRLGRALNYKAMRLTGLERNDTFEEASIHLSKAIRLDRSLPEPHVEMARTLGYMGLFKPDWDNYNLAGRISEELDYAIRQNPKYADAFYLYGLWNRFVSQRSLLIRMPYGLGSASNENALENFKEAVKIEPENAEYLMELGKQYLQMEDIDNAKKNFVKVSAFTVNLYNRKFVEEAKEILEEMQ